MHTDDGDGTGYGYMWWIYRAGSTVTARYPMLGKQAFYRALGTGEQGLWAIGGADLVVVHRADTDHGLMVVWKGSLAAGGEHPGGSPDRADAQPGSTSAAACGACQPTSHLFDC